VTAAALASLQVRAVQDDVEQRPDHQGLKSDPGTIRESGDDVRTAEKTNRGTRSNHPEDGRRLACRTRRPQ